MDNLFGKNGIWIANDYTMLDANHLNKAIQYLKTTQINSTKIGISANDYNQEYAVDFNLIKDNFPKITDFWARCLLNKETDISPLYDLQYLQSIQWWAKTPLTITNFPKLETLHCIYPENIHFDSETLKKLSIVGAKNLLFLHQLPHLNSLEIKGYKGENLSGIENIPSLQHLSIQSAKKLFNLNEIKQCPSLKTLTLENMYKNIDLSALLHSNIEELYLHIVVENCDFIKEMPHLMTFLCKEITNNDLSPMFMSKTLSNAYLYKHKKAYNYTKDEFETRFSW